MKFDLDNAAAIGPSEAMIAGVSRRRRFFHAVLVTLFAGTLFAISAPAQTTERLALRPPIGWNDWARSPVDYGR